MPPKGKPILNLRGHIRLASAEGGFSLPLIVVTALILLVGGLALANRANQGLFGAIFQNQSWEAKSAAEIGMARIVSELNREINRGLITKKSSTDSGGLWASASLEERKNACLPDTTGNTPSLSLIDPNSGASTSAYGQWFIQADGTVTATQGTATRSFRLLRVSRTATEPDATATSTYDGNLFIGKDRPNPDNRAIVIEVEGRSLRGETTTSSIILEKKFEVTPKCCGVPFGEAQGNLDYTDASAALCSRPLGLGILGGSSGTDTGSITLRGRLTTIEDAEGTPVNPIYCLASNDAGCTINTTSTSTAVDVIDRTLPPVPTYANTNPPPSLNKNAAVLPTGRNTSSPGVIDSCSLSGGMKKVWTCLGKTSPTTTDFAYPSCPGGSTNDCATVINADADPANIPSSYCSLNLDNPNTTGIDEAGTEVHCNISSLSGSGPVFFKTSTRKLRLYFPSGGTAINFAGNGYISHCNSVTNGTCGDNTNLLSTDLSLFGSPTESQTVRIQGGSEAVSLFMYFPKGSVTLSGRNPGDVPKFEGILWTDDIISSGNIEWVVPGSGLASAYTLLGMLGTDDTNPILYDYVLRATDYQRWKGG